MLSALCRSGFSRDYFGGHTAEHRGFRRSHRAIADTGSRPAVGLPDTHELVDVALEHVGQHSKGRQDTRAMATGRKVVGALGGIALVVWAVLCGPRPMRMHHRSPSRAHHTRYCHCHEQQ